MVRLTTLRSASFTFILGSIMGVVLFMYIFNLLVPTPVSVKKSYSTDDVIRLSSQCWQTQLVDLSDDEVVECRGYLDLKYTPVPVDQMMCKDEIMCESK